jgi:glycerol-3-phosphate acyltransferase PlsX
MIHVAIDGMGGDHAPTNTTQGVRLAVAANPDLHCLVYGDEAILSPLLQGVSNVRIVHTSEVISMDEKAAIEAMRRDKTSSLSMAMQAVVSGQAQAIVSAGPTGAMVAGAHILIKRIQGMKRTALMPVLWSKGRVKLLLDVGANIETKPEHLVQYAFAASIYAQSVLGVANPKVGLLNNGTEEGKGRELEQAAFKLLQQEPTLQFVGNVEAKEFFTSDVHVYVTDGYTGNAVLKAIEATLSRFSSGLKNEIKASKLAMVGAVLMKRSLRGVKSYFDVAAGAILLGVNAPVIKAHGSSSPEEFASAIQQAFEVAKGDVVTKLKTAIESEVSDAL